MPARPLECADDTALRSSCRPRHRGDGRARRRRDGPDHGRRGDSRAWRSRGSLAEAAPHPDLKMTAQQRCPVQNYAAGDNCGQPNFLNCHSVCELEALRCRNVIVYYSSEGPAGDTEQQFGDRHLTGSGNRVYPTGAMSMPLWLASRASQVSRTA